MSRTVLPFTMMRHSEPLESRTLLTGLTIVPTFAPNISRDPHAVQIEAAIRAGIAQIDSLFANPITVPILFEEGPGLGSSLTGFGDLTYAAWRQALLTHATDANQRSAVATLPANNTLNGSDDVAITYANELALGLPDTYPKYFSTITLNTAACNLTRTSIDPNKYDLQDVAMHEMDEALGISSVLDEVQNGQKIPTDAINPEDFFRYSAGPNGQRDFTTSAKAAVYFSIDGGKTDLAQFNQDSSGDFNDWYSINGDQIPQVQDAFGVSGVISNYNVEPVVLDVLGYKPTRTLGTGIVSGVVFNDANGDGVQDGSDTNLAGWTVEALQDGKVVASTVSDGQQYQLDSLPAGTYTIQIIPQPGYAPTVPAQSVTITGQNDTISSTNFGELPAAIGPISGTVFNDVTGNGVLDGLQTPMAGVKVSLHIDTNGNGRLDARDKLIGTVITNASGTYSFSNLAIGQYFVSETVPRGYVRTAPSVTSIESVYLNPGQPALGQNFENFKKPASLGVAKISYAIGTTVVKNLKHRTNAGDTVTATFTVTRPAGEQLSLVSYTSPSPIFSPATAAGDQVFDSASTFFAPGTYTLTVDLPTTGNYEVDFVVGSPITQFGPAGSSIFYTSQKRLISTDHA